MKRFIFWVSFLALSACGTGRGGGEDSLGSAGSGVKICPANYDPLPLERKGHAPIQDISLLPQGRYTETGAEVYLSQISGGQRMLQFHFTESVDGPTLTQTAVCASALGPQDTFSYQLIGLASYIKAQGREEVLARDFQISSEGGVPSFIGKLDPGIGSGGLQFVLSRFPQYFVYRISENEYEVRSRFKGPLGGGFVTEALVMHLHYSRQ